MMKKTRPNSKDKVRRTAATPPLTTASQAEKRVPADPDENMKWMTVSRLLLAVVTVVGALAARGWMSARRAGQPTVGPRAGG